FVLVRLFVTQPFGKLPPDLRAFAARLAGRHDLSADARCLALLASAGDHPDWNGRSRSREHKAIPIASEALIGRFPMISQLLSQLGLTRQEITGAYPGIILDHAQRTYNVFYVRCAGKSPYVVEQEGFVRPFGIRSVVGFGAGLPSGQLIVIVGFSRVEIPPEV